MEKLNALTKEELTLLKEKKVVLVPGEMRSIDVPSMKGMPLCTILMDGKLLTTINGDTHQKVTEEVLKYLRENVL